MLINNLIENLFNRMLQESKKYIETNVYISKSRHEDDEKNAQHISEDLFQRRIIYLSSMVTPSYPPPSLPRHATFPGKPASSHFAADRCACSLACLSMISFWTASSPPILALLAAEVWAVTGLEVRNPANVDVRCNADVTFFHVTLMCVSYTQSNE